MPVVLVACFWPGHLHTSFFCLEPEAYIMYIHCKKKELFYHHCKRINGWIMYNCIYTTLYNTSDDSLPEQNNRSSK